MKKSTNIWGVTYQVGKVGSVHAWYYKSKRKAVEAAVTAWQGGGDWIVTRIDRRWHKKIVYRTDRC